MKVTFNIYNAFGYLPDPDWIFKLVRRTDFLMKQNPNKNWNTIKEWARPMNQLACGLFLNITDAKVDEIEKKIDFEGDASEDLRLELQWIDRGYVRVCFDTEDPMPYRIITGKCPLRSG